MDNNFQNILENLRKTIDKEDFNGSLLDGYSKEDFWKEILEYMNYTNDIDKHVPLWQREIFQNIDVETIFKEIVKNIDLDFPQEGQTSKQSEEDFRENLKTFLLNNNLWNSSVSDLIKEFYQKTDPNYNNEKEESNRLPDQDWTLKEKAPYVIKNGGLIIGEKENNGEKQEIRFKLSDIKNADAGYKFVGPYVRPQYNVDENTYLGVRGDDKNEYALTNDKELQYTREKTNKDMDYWLRLLMPKYLRYVEVEDLNRNFWVISQVLTALGAYVLGNDSFYNICEEMLEEIAQLWENILYLWILSILETKKKNYSDIHYEIVYLSEDNYSTEIRYDSFDNISSYFIKEDNKYKPEWSLISDKLKYLKKEYNESNLIILPVIRLNNYRHNYYSKIAYPGIYYYDRNTDSEKYEEFNLSYSTNEFQELFEDLSDNDFTIPCFDISNEFYEDNLYGIYEKEETYIYTYPLKNSGVNATKYFGLLKPNYEYFKINEENINSDTLDLIINFEDIGYKLIQRENRNLFSFEIKIENFFNFEERSSNDFDFLIDINNEEFESISGEENITSGFYQGEMLSISKMGITIEYIVNYSEESFLPVFLSEEYETSFFDLHYQGENEESLDIVEIYDKIVEYGFVDYFVVAKIATTVNFNQERYLNYNDLETNFDVWYTNTIDLFYNSTPSKQELLYDGTNNKGFVYYFDSINNSIEGNESISDNYDLIRIYQYIFAINIAKVVSFKEKKKIGITIDNIPCGISGGAAERLPDVMRHDAQCLESLITQEIGSNQNGVYFFSSSRPEECELFLKKAGESSVDLAPITFLCKKGSKNVVETASVPLRYPHGTQLSGAYIGLLGDTISYPNYFYNTYSDEERDARIIINENLDPNEEPIEPDNQEILKIHPYELKTLSFWTLAKDDERSTTESIICKFEKAIAGSSWQKRYYWMTKNGEPLNIENWCLITVDKTNYNGVLKGSHLNDIPEDRKIDYLSIYNYRDPNKVIISKEKFEEYFLSNIRNSQELENWNWTDFCDGENSRLRSFIDDITDGATGIDSNEKQEAINQIIDLITSQADYLDKLSMLENTFNPIQINTSRGLKDLNGIYNIPYIEKSFGENNKKIFLPHYSSYNEQTNISVFTPEDFAERMYLKTHLDYNDRLDNEKLGHWNWEMFDEITSNGKNIDDIRQGYKFLKTNNQEYKDCFEVFKGNGVAPGGNGLDYPFDDNYAELIEKYEKWGWDISQWQQNLR